MSRFAVQTHALLRIISGFTFMWWGSQKLLSFPSPPPEGLPWYVLKVAGPLELGCGLLIFLGLFTRHAAFLASGLMAVAYWKAHGLTHALPIMNGGELAILYCFIFLFLAANGPGTWSLDKVLKET
jgi:putative oxidoreductase